MIAALVLAAALAQEGGHLARAEVRLRGPIARATLDLGARGRTTIVSRLLVGEERVVLVALPARPLGDRAPAITPDDGRVEFVGYVAAGEELERLPIALRRRPRPVLRAGPPRPDPIALLLVAATAALVLAARRRAAPVLALGLLGAASIAAAQLRRPPPPPERVRVLEGHGDSGRWLRVEGAAGALRFDPARDLDLECAPAGAALELAGRVGGVESWRAELAGGRLWRLAPLDPGARRLTSGANLWGPLTECWSRTGDGTWSAHGPWELGAPLPPARAGGAAPGWLASGLPQGQGVLLARLAPGAWDGAPGGVGDAREERRPRTWLRLVGLDFDPGR